MGSVGIGLDWGDWLGVGRDWWVSGRIRRGEGTGKRGRGREKGERERRI
jgi:hypothetical protein